MTSIPMRLPGPCAQDAPFYVTGGSLPDHAPCYVVRQADNELLEALHRGEFCYVLDTRQVGKSSLMVRAAARLRADGCHVAVLDLSAAGQSVSTEQWYFGLLYSIAAQLGLEDEMETFWTEHSSLGPAQRWVSTLREVALPGISGPLIVFIDEIDAVRSLPFSADEFFAVVRECYNRRTQDAAFARLTVCLIGVATPAQLIRDTRTTPFNIGRRIDLTDFTPAEAAPLERGLRLSGLSAGDRQALIGRALFWTGGHPYLTQRLCRALAENGQARSVLDVDRVCAATFLTRQGRETDPNLAFARDRMLSGDGADAASVLSLYANVRAERSAVRYNPTDPRADILRLSGVAAVVNGALVLRNRLYARAFDRRWIAANLPGEEVRRQRRALWRGVTRASLFWVVVLTAPYAAYQQSLQARVSRNLAASESWKRQQAETKMHVLRRNVDQLQAKEVEAEENLGHLRAKGSEAEENLSRLRAKEVEAKKQLRAAVAKLTNARRQASVERANTKIATAEAQAERARVESMSGEIASAFAAKPETGTTALEYGLRAVETALRQGRRPPEAAVAGLTEAVDSGIFRRLVLHHPDPVLTACFSPDNRRILTAAIGRYAYLWDAGSGRLLHRLTVQQRPTRRQYINSAEFSPDGRTLLTASDEEGKVALWRAGSSPDGVPRPLRVLQRDPVTVCYAEFSRDGRYVAALAADNEIRIHDLRTGKSRLLGIRPEDRHTGYLWTVSFSNDGTKLVTAGSDGTARVWDAETGKLLAHLDWHRETEMGWPRPSSGVVSARFQRFDELVLTAGQDRVARLWNWKQGQTYRKIMGHNDWIWSLWPNASGTYVATAGRDNKAMVWAMGGWDGPLHVLAAHTASVFSARFSPDERELVTASADRTAQVWRFTGKAFLADGTGMNFAEFSPDGRSIGTASGDRTFRIFRVSSGEETAIAWLPDKILHVAFSPDGLRVATADQGFRVRLYDLMRRTDGHPTLVWESNVRREEPEGYEVAELTFSRDGVRMASAGPGFSTRMFDARTGKILWERHFGGLAVCAAFHPDGGRVLLVARDNTVELADAATGRTLRAFRLPGRHLEPDLFHNDGPTSGAISPDGRLLLVGDRNQRAYLFDAATGRLLGVLTGHTETVSDVTFSPNGRQMATAGADRTVRVWDIAEAIAAWRQEKAPRPLLTLRGHPVGVQSVRFSPDGQSLVTGCQDNAARVFPATLEGYVRKAHQILTSASGVNEAPTGQRTSRPVGRRSSISNSARTK